MRAISNEEYEKLKKAFEIICNLNFASEKSNHSTCGVFHIQPFNTHWDKKTVKEIIYNMRLYLSTWAIPEMENALKLSSKKVEQRRRIENRAANKRKKEWMDNLKNKTK